MIRKIMLKSMIVARMIRTIDAFVYPVKDVGGVENLGFLKRDAYNYI